MNLTNKNQTISVECPSRVSAGARSSISQLTRQANFERAKSGNGFRVINFRLQVVLLVGQLTCFRFSDTTFESNHFGAAENNTLLLLYLAPNMVTCNHFNDGAI